MNGSANPIVDLTVLLEHGMLAFPGEPTCGFVPFSTIERDDVEMWQVSLFSQVGTHIDAPSHFLSGQRTVDALELDRCLGPATVIEASSAVDDGRIDVTHLEPFAESARRTRRVLIRTDWDAHLGTAAYYTAYPSLTYGAADWLVARGVRFLGLDTPSPHSSEFRPMHEALFVDEMVIAEGLVGLARLSGLEVVLLALPLPLRGLDGSPARIVAIDSAALASAWSRI